MGLLDRLNKKFDRGAPSEEDPHEPIAVETVPVVEAESIVDALRRDGFSANAVAVADGDTPTSTGVRIMVPRGEAHAARAALDHLR